ncbi:hypothetical protein ABID70_001697 [Clavibacter michiganensis]
MGLVDDDRVVLPQQPVALQLVEQDPVGHELDAGVGGDLVGEAHLVADQLADLAAELLRDALRDGARGEPARLRVADALAAELEADLRQLRGLAGARRSRDDDDLVVADGVGDLVPHPADGELGRVRDAGFHAGVSLSAGRRAPRGRAPVAIVVREAPVSRAHGRHPSSESTTTDGIRP